MSKLERIKKELRQQKKAEGNSQNIVNIRKLLDISTSGDLFRELVQIKHIGKYPNCSRTYYMNDTFKDLIKEKWL